MMRLPVRLSHCLSAILMLPILLIPGLLAGCGDRPSDYVVDPDAPVDEEPPPAPTGAAPTCMLDSTTGTTGDITVTFTTADADGDLVTIFILFSTNSGATYTMATGAASNTFPNGSGNLSPSEGAVFIWDSMTDVGAAPITVRVRIVVADFNHPAVNCDSMSLMLNPGSAVSPPSCTIDAPAMSAVLGHDIPISYTLTDDDNATTASILAQFSTDGGTTFTTATLATGSPDGTTGLSTSTSGAPHTFLWDSLTDIPAQDTTPSAMVVFRITATDDDGTGTGCSSGVFTVDGTAPTNTAPTCTIVNPAGGETLTGGVTLDYMLADAEDTTGGEITVSFSTDAGVTFATATEIAGAPSEGITGLTMSVAGTMHTFIWNSLLDVPEQQAAQVMTVRLRIRPSDGTLTGSSCSTLDFNLEAPPALAASSMVVGNGTATFNDTACCGALASPLILFSETDTVQVVVTVDFAPSPTDVDVTTAMSMFGSTTYMIADPTVATVSLGGLVTAAAGSSNRCTTLTTTFTPNGTLATGAPGVRTIACCVDPGGATNEQRAGPDVVSGTADDRLIVGDMDLNFPASASALPIGAGGTFDLRVTVNVGGNSLGAYGLDIAFTNTVLIIDTSMGTMGVTNSSAHPSIMTFANPENPLGRLRVNGFDVSTGNTGIFDLCTIHCMRVATGSSLWNMMITDLASTPVAAPIGAATPRLAGPGTGTVIVP